MVSSSSATRSLLRWQTDAVVIDRDPEHFGSILAFLRSGTCALPNNTASLLALRTEAEAYQVRVFLPS